VIDLPDWFSALNQGFRYQLTVVGAPGPNLYIAEEISNTESTTSNYDKSKSKFRIAGGVSGTKVSWQVTGYEKTLGPMLTGSKSKKINLLKNGAISYILISMASQKKKK
jgi:hypothetical protein